MSATATPAILLMLLKLTLNNLIEPLVYISNLSFRTGCVPDSLKIAKVIPIFKKGDKSNPSNYRPISLLSIFHKLLEKTHVQESVFISS